MVQNKFRHLHPTTLLFNLLDVIKRFLIPGILLIYFGGGRSYELFFMIFAFPALAISIINYLHFTYRLSEHELIVKHGILNRRERHVPFHRIQNVDTRQNILHRMLKVADAIIQTASGAEPEAELKVLSFEDIEYIRKQIFTDDRIVHKPPHHSTEDRIRDDERERRIIARVPLRDLIMYGVISNRGMVVVAAAMGILYQFNVELIQRWFKALPSFLNVLWSGSLISRSIAGAFVVVGAIVLLRLFSIFLAIITFYNFTLTRQKDELLVRYGLFTEHSLTIPISHIQRIEVESTVLHRVFGFARIKARTAGTRSGEDSKQHYDHLIPIVEHSQIHQILNAINPDIAYDYLEWKSVERRAIRRLFFKLTAFFAIPGLLLTYYYEWIGAVSWVIIFPLSFTLAYFQVKHMGFTFWEGTIWIKHGWLTRRMYSIRHEKIQSVSLLQTPFDRRLNMASVYVDTANAGAQKLSTRIPYLYLNNALEIYNRLRQEAADKHFEWS